jgi:hypothetical protein
MSGRFLCLQQRGLVVLEPDTCVSGGAVGRGTCLRRERDQLHGHLCKYFGGLSPCLFGFVLDLAGVYLSAASPCHPFIWSMVPGRWRAGAPSSVHALPAEITCLGFVKQTRFVEGSWPAVSFSVEQHLALSLCMSMSTVSPAALPASIPNSPMFRRLHL